VSCRAEGAAAVPAAFGLSPSTVSRRLVSARALRRLGERRVDWAACRARVRDGNTFAADALVIALGLPRAGQTGLLGVVQPATETAAGGAAFWRALVERGRHSEDGLLGVLDGANGLRKAGATVWGAKALVQRWPWHTREHGVRSLPTRHQVTWRRTLPAYARPPSPDAQAALLRRRTEVGLRNASAVGSLDEGLEETLTRHRLGRFQALGVRLKPITCLESRMAQVGQVPATGARWRTADQQRWVARALRAIEPRLRRITGYRGTNIGPSFGLSYSERRRRSQACTRSSRNSHGTPLRNFNEQWD